MVELSHVAFQAFQARQFAAAITLTRAAVETVAALWYVEEKVAAALKDDKLTDIDSYIMRLLSGNYLWDDFPNPFRVGKFIKAVERRVPGFKDEYSRLSEYAHPNSTGTVGLYNTIDRDKILVDFGPNQTGVNAAQGVCIANLSVALMLFEHSYNKLSDMMHDCEKEIPTARCTVLKRVSFVTKQEAMESGPAASVCRSQNPQDLGVLATVAAARGPKCFSEYQSVLVNAQAIQVQLDV